MTLIEINHRNHFQHKRMIKRMAADVMPVDKSWQVILTFAAVIFINAALFVRWWLCV